MDNIQKDMNKFNNSLPKSDKNINFKCKLKNSVIYNNRQNKKNN